MPKPTTIPSAKTTMTKTSIWHLFVCFMKAGGLTIGDGYATIAPLRKAITHDHQWMSEEEFDTQLTLVQAVPGIFNVNFAAFLGYRLNGWKGCAAALAGMVLPPFLLLLLIARFYRPLSQAPLLHSFLMGARPAIIVLLLLPCFKILKKSSLSLSTIWIPVGAAIAIVLMGISPVYIIGGFTFIGILYAIQVMMSEH